jgi:hypothetical protein
MSLSKFESVLLPGTIEEADHAAMVLSDQLRELMSADKATDTEEYALAVVGQSFRNTSWAMEHERDQLLGTAYGLAARPVCCTIAYAEGPLSKSS